MKLNFERINSKYFEVYDNSYKKFAVVHKRESGYRITCIGGCENGKTFLHSNWRDTVICCSNILKINESYYSKIIEILEARKTDSLEPVSLREAFQGEKESLKLFLTALNLKAQNKLNININNKI